MRLVLVLIVAATTVSLAGELGAQTPAAVAAPDYSNTANWVCRPGAEDVCTAGLDAVAIYPDGHRVAQPFVPAKDPAVDCFYVYPTVSREQTELADMTDSPEIQQVTRAQAGRLSSRCRVYAPVYRQVTLYGLRKSMTGGGGMNFAQSLEDVEAAWAYYLKHDNKGRGVVLVGHSQGTILLQSLIAKAIDAMPSQSLLVSGFLAGDPSLAVPQGKAVGGTFKQIPVCAAAAQTGCVYVWGSYTAEDDTKNQMFGRARNDGQMSACAIPAAPAGGSGTLKFFYSKPATAPASDPPWVEAMDQVSGACRADQAGNALRVTVMPGPYADFYTAFFKRSGVAPGWGLHVLDIGLEQGNMLDVLDAEIASWRKTH